MNSKRIKELFENRLFPRTRNAIRSFLGIKALQLEVDSLYYYLNKYVDIRNLPPTDDPDLRILQKCDAMLLGIFDKMCAKHNLTYWIEYGTLLGAVRHEGFIPWDDDTDIAMPRDDFNRAFGAMSDELAKYGIGFYYKYNDKLHCLCLEYQHEKTGVWCDISPMDEYRSDLDYNDAKDKIAPRIMRYMSYYDRHHKKRSSEEIWNKKNAIIFFDSKGEQQYFFHGQEFRQSAIRIFNKKDLMPTQRFRFEEVELNAPSNPDAVLRACYGDKYMSFPRNGLEHHGGKKGKLKKWAKRSGIDMVELYNYLTSIYKSV